MSQLEFHEICTHGPLATFHSPSAGLEGIERRLLEILLRVCELNEEMSRRMMDLEERVELLEMEVMA